MFNVSNMRDKVSMLLEQSGIPKRILLVSQLFCGQLRLWITMNPPKLLIRYILTSDVQANPGYQTREPNKSAIQVARATLHTLNMFFQPHFFR